jgi:hypothetical protein
MRHLDEDVDAIEVIEYMTFPQAETGFAPSPGRPGQRVIVMSTTFQI